MPSSSIEVRDLRYRYPGEHHDALTGLSLSVSAGERVAVLGPNGSGKTTFVMHLNGLLSMQSGEIAIGDTSVTEDHLREIRRRVGAVFQDADDQLFMTTVREDVAFGPANLGVTGDELNALVEQTLARVGASGYADRNPHHLSGGEKRRVAIATVLSMNPDVLILDEPTSGLDPAGRRELIDLLAGLDQTQLIVTHDLPLALQLCERSVIVSGGQVVADGATAELLADEALLAQHRLELPLGFDPSRL
ncbi:MAG: ABC transporter ATP-binding protein [Actinobacteria bacterium]|jgi:cobalt/nickel transport system ATP-binding protein|nr:ABC transporter ATP-binding protein [Ilumatobacteraceae bacterium]MDA0300238.1 ABC transporter ATP-binding protein [Actinomycetota bacterium]MDA2995606.1 ABC transporter ATP-binding protein [Actinomycetota bacterium]